ncbi:MAG TPA: hypothetical protein VGE56_04345 [Rhodocyclaceae bacterium]
MYEPKDSSVDVAAFVEERAVSAAVLGAIEGPVGAMHQVAQALGFIAERAAEAHGEQAVRRIGILNACGFHALSQLFQAAQAIFRIAVMQQQYKFFSATAHRVLQWLSRESLNKSPE